MGEGESETAASGRLQRFAENKSFYSASTATAIFLLVSVVLGRESLHRGYIAVNLEQLVVVMLIYTWAISRMFRDLDDRAGWRAGRWLFGAMILPPVVLPVYVALRLWRG